MVYLIKYSLARYSDLFSISLLAQLLVLLFFKYSTKSKVEFVMFASEFVFTILIILFLLSSNDELLKFVFKFESIKIKLPKYDIYVL